MKCFSAKGRRKQSHEVPRHLNVSFSTPFFFLIYAIPTCKGLKELVPANVSNVAANQGAVSIATGDFSEESAAWAQGPCRGVRGPGFWQTLHGNVAGGHTKFI